MMSDEMTVRALRMRLERGEAAAADAAATLAVWAVEAPTRTTRLDACCLLGELAGRALGAEWDVAERAAFALLEAARLADTAADRRGVIAAMGRGFRNLWLLPFVHRRLTDRDPTIAAAALRAAGGLGFPALEDAVAGFITDAAPAELRKAAIAALGRMGAMSAIDRLVPLVTGDPTEAAAALTALTEIRSPAASGAALVVLEHDLEPEVQIAALSVTEWARMMVLFAVDHPSGFKNLMRVGPAGAAPGPTRERIVALAHRLHTLAAVRNLVTHRASAGSATLGAFRKSYYTAFEDLVAFA